MTKICVTCKELKTFDSFAKMTKSKDGLQARCRSCAKEAYNADRAKQIARVSARNLAHRAELKKYVWELKSNPCTDCGNSYHPVVMDFDHVRGDKSKDISLMVRSAVSLQKLKEEISKCELVCSNCHRIRTFTRSGQLASIAEMV